MISNDVQHIADMKHNEQLYYKDVVILNGLGIVDEGGTRPGHE